MATTGKIAEVMFEKALETHELEVSALNTCEFIKPDEANMQNADNVVWRPVQQHAPIIDGWDLSGQETDIIEETYPAMLGTPKNDFVKQRADNLRDMGFWERRGEESGRRQAAELNKGIVEGVRTQGSMFYRSNATSGYDFIAEAQALMNERQAYNSGRCFFLNDRDNLKFGKDLAARQTLQGRPETTWATGQIGQNIAEFDVYAASFLPNLAGGATPTATVTGDVSEKPEAGSVNTATGVVTNIDYRLGTIAVSASASYNIGDKIQFENSGTAVEALGTMDKSETAQAMTFTVVGKPDGTTIQVYPKPIAANDAGLSALEKASANINTQILNGADVVRLNTDANAKSNVFWDKSAVEVIGGTIPNELFTKFDGMQSIRSTMANGQDMYMVYDGKIEDMSFRYRIFTWWGVTIANPANCGVAVSYT